MILSRIESTSQLCLILSPYRTSTSESKGHTVTGMEKHLAVKITLRRINLQRNVVKRSTTASTTDSSATKPSGRRWLKWDALKRSSRRWISLQVKITLTKANKEEIDFYRKNWWIHTNVAHFDSVPTRYEPDFKKALSTMHSLKRAEDEKKHATWSHNSFSSSWQWHASWWKSDSEYSPQKMVWPLIARGNPFLGGSISICGKSLNMQRIQNFYRESIGYSWRQSTVTDGRCTWNISCTWYSTNKLWYTMATEHCVHLHTQTSTTLSALWPIAWTPQCTLTRTLRSSEHAAHRL